MSISSKFRDLFNTVFINPDIVYPIKLRNSPLFGHGIQHRKKDGGCTFYQNAMRASHSPLGTRKVEFFCKICPCTNEYTRFEYVRTSLYVFMSVVKVFVRVNVTVAIFFPMEDWN